MTDETLQTVLDSVTAGDTLKRAIANAHTSWRALAAHMAANEDAARQYARARTVSAQFYADKGQEAIERAHDNESATVARVQADWYRWRAGVADKTYSTNHTETVERKQLTVRVIDEREPLPAYRGAPLLRAADDVDALALPDSELGGA